MINFDSDKKWLPLDLIGIICVQSFPDRSDYISVLII